MKAYFMNGETQKLSWVDALALKRDFFFVDFNCRWTTNNSRKFYLVEKYISAEGVRVNYSAHTSEQGAVKTINKLLKGKQ